MDGYWDYILGGLDVTFMKAFYTFSGLGMLFSMLVHYDRKRRKNKKEKRKTTFKIKFWLKDNTIRLLTNLITIFIFLRFSVELKLDNSPTMFMGLMFGLGIDQLVIMLRKMTLVNTSQDDKP